MDRSELKQLLDQYKAARRPEAIFGVLDGDLDEKTKALQKKYRKMAVRLHPDRFASNPEMSDLATTAMAIFNSWKDEALRLLKGQRYGYRPTPARQAATGLTLSHGPHTWEVIESLDGGDISEVYVASETSASSSDLFVLKVVRNAANNDLLDDEARALNRLMSGPTDEVELFRQYLPELLFTFRLADGRRVNVLEYAEGYVPLTEVMAAYPDGVDERTMSWMFRRVLELLSWVHGQNYVHGAVLPTHVLIHPVTHGAMLIDWSYAVVNQGDLGGRIKAVSKPYRSWYPDEVLQKKHASPATDLYMLAKTMVAVAGGRTFSGTLPERYATSFSDVLRACLLPRAEDRYSDAFTVYTRFRDILLREHGPPRYHPFTMP